MNYCEHDLRRKINLLVIVILFLPVYLLSQDGQPKKIIYETDMCLDVDDAGALAILHAMANNGEAEILAVSFNEVHPSGAAAIDAMNTWYGRGDIPVGIYKKTLASPDGSGYLAYVAKFPNDLTNEAAPNALDVYREVLSAQPDSSVTIVSVGFLNNIYDLLKAEPELVAKKVVELVQMAGVNNDGFNLVRHNLVNVSEYVIKNWPTKMVISQAGGDIYTGENYQYAPQENPYREAFYRFFGGRYDGRSSWDEMAVLYGVRGLSTYFGEITWGTGSLSNGYVWNMQAGWRTYLSNRNPNSFYEKLIMDLMDKPPKGANISVTEKSGWLPFTVELDASASYAGGDRTVQQWLWDFGDGDTGEGEVVHHEYITSGIFDIQLTIIDDLGDSLKTNEQVHVSDPVFSPIPYFGSVQNYDRSQMDLWSTRIDEDDLRYYVNNEQRDSDSPMPGFSLIKDSIYSDFSLNITVKSGENLSQNRLADYSIIFGYENKDNYNYMLMKQTTSRLVNVSNAVPTDITSVTQKGIPDDQYHDVVLNLSGNQITVFIDDSLFLSASSARLLKIGKIGVGSPKYAAFFDDISISGTGLPVSVQHNNPPGQFKLWQNYPNPFNPSTIIKFNLPEPENVKIDVYSITGQKIETILDKPMAAGFHEIEFNGKNLNSGTYLLRINAGIFRDVKKMVLLK
jgi:PKD repeat protein